MGLGSALLQNDCVFTNYILKEAKGEELAEDEMVG